MKAIARTVVSCCTLLLAAWAPVAAQAPAPPVVKEGRTVKVSEHVWVIPDETAPMVPNVGIVVGSRGTLIWDPGMGRRSGEIVMGEAQKVRKGSELYIVNSHFHPEHTTGEIAFPPSVRILRAAAQQQDVEEMGMQWVRNFASRSPVIAQVLEGFTAFRPPAEIFEREKVLDLGGVRVRMVWLGPGHTRGDTILFVEGDRVLFSGDLAMKGVFPAFATPQSSGRSWLAGLDELDRLQARTVVGAHYPVSDASVIGEYRDYLKGLQARVAELKKQGKSSDETAEQVKGEFAARYKDWAQPMRIAAAAAVFYREE